MFGEKHKPILPHSRSVEHKRAPEKQTPLSNLRNITLVWPLALAVLSPALTRADPAVPGWVQLYNGLGGQDPATTVAVDSSGNVIVTGIALKAGGSEYVTIKYSNVGVPLWTNRHSAQINQPAAMAVDRNDDVIVAGTSESSDGGFD